MVLAVVTRLSGFIKRKLQQIVLRLDFRFLHMPRVLVVYLAHQLSFLFCFVLLRYNEDSHTRLCKNNPYIYLLYVCWGIDVKVRGQFMGGSL